MKRIVRTAVILAAGCGLRMKDAGLKRPKGFITIGQIPIVEESVIRLSASGISRLLIVTGHLQDYYIGLAARYPELITLVHNSRYEDSGSMYSLSLVAEQINESFLLLESDLVYEQRALAEVMGHPSADTILVSGPTGSGDEVHVETSDEHLLRAMAKDRTRLGPHIIGELVGISKLSHSCFLAMIRHADEVFLRTLRLDYEDALVAAAETVPLHCHLIADLVWSEIDDEAQLSRVRRTVYPAILAREGKVPDS
jgi:choline kinase